MPAGTEASLVRAAAIFGSSSPSARPTGCPAREGVALPHPRPARSRPRAHLLARSRSLFPRATCDPRAVAFPSTPRRTTRPRPSSARLGVPDPPRAPRSQPRCSSSSRSRCSSRRSASSRCTPRCSAPRESSATTTRCVSPANPRAPRPSSPRRPVPRASNQTSSLLVHATRDLSPPPAPSNAPHPPQTTMAELTALRKEVGEVRAVTSELRDARTELTNARVSLREVMEHVAGAETTKATRGRRVLASGSDGDEVVPGEEKSRAPRRAGPGPETRGGSIGRGAMTSTRTRRRR
jgi:hypothetical protein